MRPSPTLRSTATFLQALRSVPQSRFLHHGLQAITFDEAAPHHEKLD